MNGTVPKSRVRAPIRSLCADKKCETHARILASVRERDADEWAAGKENEYVPLTIIYIFQEISSDVKDIK
jgi:hypothetical protein